MEGELSNFTGDVGYDISVVDFEDAFHTLSLKEIDRGVMAIKTVSGWAVFRRLCCGMAAAPLVWCRVGAAAGRLGQALFLPTELRLQIFVDDPAIVTKGTSEERAWLLGVLLLFWAALGFKFNWAKASRGQTVNWIGAKVAVERRDGVPGVFATLAPKKFEELRANVANLKSAKGLVNIALVRKVAGQLSWASGLLPWIRSFNTMLWGAIAAHEGEAFSEKFSQKKRPTQLFFIVRVAQAVLWISRLLAGAVVDNEGRKLPVQRWLPLTSRVTSLRACVRTDASPFGFGAVFFVNGVPREWLAEVWTEVDAEVLRADLGDPAWQAEWELLALLRAVDA